MTVIVIRSSVLVAILWVARDLGGTIWMNMDGAYLCSLTETTPQRKVNRGLNNYFNEARELIMTTLQVSLQSGSKSGDRAGPQDSQVHM